MTVTQLDSPALDSLARSVVTIGRRARGLGVVIGQNLVLTNAHNIRNSQVTVGIDGDAKVGEVTGVSLDDDLAVISVETGDTPAVEWQGDISPELGAEVFGLSRRPDGGVRFTAGYVSSVAAPFRGPRGRLLTGVEHTTPLPRGSSGGPLFDAAGKLIGINTHRLDDGFYLAQPADAHMHELAGQLQRGEQAGRQRLGIAVAPSHVALRLRSAVGLSERDGVLVQAVDPDGPAGRSGVTRGDLIVAVGESAIDSVDALFAAIDTQGNAPHIDITVVRGNDETNVRVQFADDSSTQEGTA